MFSAVSERVAPEDYVAAVPRLREIGEIGRRFGIVIGIEFIRSARFLGCLETTSKLLREAAHPNLGVLLDTFHFYAGISKIADIVKLHGGEISFVHIDDVPAMPRELLEDKHRVFVGDGVLPLEEILRALAKVYQGPLSFEVFQYADQDPYAVAIKAFDGLARLLAASRKTESSRPRLWRRGGPSRPRTGAPSRCALGSEQQESGCPYPNSIP
jgi:sugar phosphate isomerase/epimerase